MLRRPMGAKLGDCDTFTPEPMRLEEVVEDEVGDESGGGMGWDGCGEVDEVEIYCAAACVGADYVRGRRAVLGLGGRSALRHCSCSRSGACRYLGGLAGCVPTRSIGEN